MAPSTSLSLAAEPAFAALPASAEVSAPESQAVRVAVRATMATAARAKRADRGDRAARRELIGFSIDLLILGSPADIANSRPEIIRE
ncbi:hypothetical protein GCM10011583_65170 [Streptomyces camponoticapitis]|uniref:Uncharacterized protein n=1 Tax=Streptomyces camponoticapitis TaxID=1616125 RepID=A0ABQ2ESY4_9ACTN|nr:hypothetical protein GCM10011583_65170 [Streptomyces camponoticapitis]